MRMTAGVFYMDINICHIYTKILTHQANSVCLNIHQGKLQYIFIVYIFTFSFIASGQLKYQRYIQSDVLVRNHNGLTDLDNIQWMTIKQTHLLNLDVHLRIFS